MSKPSPVQLESKYINPSKEQKINKIPIAIPRSNLNQSSNLEIVVVFGSMPNLEEKILANSDSKKICNPTIINPIEKRYEFKSKKKLNKPIGPDSVSKKPVNPNIKRKKLG